MPNLEPYLQHSGGPLDSRPHLPPISPIERNPSSENNVGTRSAGSASHSSTGAGFAVVSQLSVQKQQSRDYLSGGLDADAENSQTSGPDTPNSSFGSFRSSSAMLEQSAWLPPLVNPASQSHFMGMDPLSRTPGRMSGSRYGDDPHSSIVYPGRTDMLSQAGSNVQDGSGPMIPVTIDLKSGSRDQAKKRKANTDASILSRHKKKKINQLTEELEILTEEIDFLSRSLSS